MGSVENPSVRKLNNVLLLAKIISRLKSLSKYGRWRTNMASPMDSDAMMQAIWERQNTEVNPAGRDSAKSAAAHLLIRFDDDGKEGDP